jgi:hypothetical protein
MTDDRRILQAILRHDLRPFIEKVFDILCPGQKFVPGWHIDAIANALERVRRGEVTRLIINLPPRSLKSIITSVAFPAFELGHNPTSRFICVSYSADLAKKHSNDFRAVVESPIYRELFPATRIGPYKNSETEIEFSAHGYRLATSIGGTLTGRGGNFIIIDDPLKPDDALSELKRTAANNWFSTTLLSRLDDKRTGAIVVVMQRVHMDDLAGFLIDTGGWEVLCLPAICEAQELIPLWGGKFHLRQPGDVLSPEREPRSVLDELKRQLGTDAFSAQYQQAPVPPGGAMIKRHWVKRYKILPPLSQRVIVVQSWDTALKGGPDNDWSVCTTWIVHEDAYKWYLVDVWRKRVNYPELRAAVIEQAQKWDARQVLIEDAGSGSILVQELAYRSRHHGGKTRQGQNDAHGCGLADVRERASLLPGGGGMAC